MFQTRKSVPELPEWFRQKNGLILCKHNCIYWFSSWTRILNVQDIFSTCRSIPSTTINGAGQYPCCARCFFHSWLVSVCICVDTMHLVHTMWAYPPNTGSMLGQRRSPLLVQCRSIVFDAGPALKQKWVIVPCLLWLPYGYTDDLSSERLPPG